LNPIDGLGVSIILLSSSTILSFDIIESLFAFFWMDLNVFSSISKFTQDSTLKSF